MKALLLTMMKTEGKGDRTLRSASPHRNAYKADFHAIKCSFDSVNTDNTSDKSCHQQRVAGSSNGGGNDPHVRGRAVTYGNRVHKIKNMFMQMGGSPTALCCENSPPSEPKIISKSASADPPPLSPSSPSFLSVQKNNLLNNGSSLCNSPQDSLSSAAFPDKIIRSSDEGNLDKAALAEKFSETRKLFERNIKKRSSLDKCTLSKDERIEDRRRHGSGSPDYSNMVEHFNFNTDVSSQVNPGKAENQGSNEQKLQQSSGSCRTSLNAGPISRRLESFLADSDSEESKDTLKNEGTPSPIQTVLCNWELPIVGEDHCLKQNPAFATPAFLSSSNVSEWDMLNRTTEEASKRDPGTSETYQQATISTSTKVDRAPIKISQVELARAELIVVQDKTLCNDNEIVGEVNVFQKEKPLRFPSWEENNLSKETEESGVCDPNQKEVAPPLEEVQRKEQDHVEQVAENEEEEEGQEVEQREDCSGFSSNVFGIENAAFDDDRETEAYDQSPGGGEMLAEEKYNYDNDYEEFPGLSEEEDPDPDKKIKFSTAPIKVQYSYM